MALVILTCHLLRFSMLGFNVKHMPVLLYFLIASCLLQFSVLHVALDFVLYKMIHYHLCSIPEGLVFFLHQSNVGACLCAKLLAVSF